MANTTRQAAARQFETKIRRSNDIHSEYLNDARQFRNYDRFTQWQLDYLLTYFEDLRTQDAYADALNFVVSELAGVSVSERDRQLARAAPAVTGLMPLGALQTLARAATLNAKTLEINLNICRHLQTDGALPEEITEEAYFVACREASNFEECMEFLHVALDLGRALSPTVRHRIIGITLKAMSIPAHATGFGDLQMFFENGYNTFRAIPDLDYFLTHTEERMSIVFRRIYAVPEPSEE